MIPLLFSVLIALLFLALIYWVLTLLPIPPNVRTIIIVVLMVMVLVYFLAPWAQKQPRITDESRVHDNTVMCEKDAAVLHHGALPS